MILALLAALFGAAQERFAFMEGTQARYFVDNHTGNSYQWYILEGINAVDYNFISSPDYNETTISWNVPGDYTLRVIETNSDGCNSIREILINVFPNNRSIAFSSSSSSESYKEGQNGFWISLHILEEGGSVLDESNFPIEVDFEIGGIIYTQRIYYDNQEIYIPDSLVNADVAFDMQTEVRILSARDANGQSVAPLNNNNLHTHTVYALPQIVFTYTDSLVYELDNGSYEVELISGEFHGAVFSWWIEPDMGTSTDLNTFTADSATIFWNGPVGTYTLYVTAVDGRGNKTDTISTIIEVRRRLPDSIVVDAGPDTIIGSCEPYLFSMVYPENSEYTYQWEPAQYLSNASIPNPVFTSGQTTRYNLTVTTKEGISFTDSVTISVSNVLANAGDDVIMEKGSTIVLNGSLSEGKHISYLWTTENGSIEDGNLTAYPVISQPGTYYLQVTDSFACSATDSVVVSQYANAPLAYDDYDTTSYLTTVNVDVLANDYDADNDLDAFTLSIISYPLSGVVAINNVDNTIAYTPNANFTGTDVFEYQICDLTQKCDNARVYVLVTPINFLIPQAFTPNGDNINDFFEILGIQYYPNNAITIINRWGKKVYEAKAYGINTNPVFWDGKSNVGSDNGDLPTGTYFYVLDLGNGEKPIAGSVYIDR